MQIAFVILMFILGAALGSFLCCQARRLHERESHHGKMPSRSICLHCQKSLKWYDNLPIISYLILRGKCRYCHHQIGRLEILSELGVATALALLSFHFLRTAPAVTIPNLAIFPSIAPINWGIFAIMLLLILSLAFLAIYDGAYGELPSFCLTISIICAIIIVILRQQASFLISAPQPALIPNQPWSPTIAALLSGALFGGLYLFLYLVSKGKWVGDGDWLLSLALGLALGHPFLALVAIFIANFSATLASMPAVVKQQKHQNHQIHFGPYLVLAFIITYTFSSFFISMI